MHSSLHTSCLRLLSSALAAVLLFVAASPCMSEAAQVEDRYSTAHELLREAVDNEKAAAAKPYVAWMDRVERWGGSITKLMVNTPQGLLARIVAINDQPLNDIQRRQDDERLNRLLDPAQMREKARKQREDERRVERILAALPDAFLCAYGTEKPQNGTVRLECSPNPRFDPPDTETQVLVGMKGEIVIDRNARRLIRMSGTLFKDVTFGWGVLGRLKRGGRIEIEQSRVLPDYWSITHMQMRFDGKIMLFKSLHVQQTETFWDFRPVPEMNVTEALDYLRNTPTPTAVSAN